MSLKKAKQRATEWLRTRRERTPRWLRVALKVVLWTVGSLLGLVLLALIVLQTPFAKAWIVRAVEESLGDKYEADIDIGGLEGVLFTGFTVHDVTIANPVGCKEPYFLVVKETDVAYNPFEMLAGEVRLEVTKVVGAEVRLEQMEGGRLNVTELFRRGRSEEEKPPLVIESADLVNALFRFDYLDEGKQDMEFSRLSGRMKLKVDSGDVELGGLTLSGTTNLYGGMRFWTSGGLRVARGGPVEFKRLSVATSSSMLYLNGELEPKQERMDLDVFSPHLSLRELRRAGLGELDPAGDAEIAGHLSGSFTDPWARLSLKLRNPSAAGYLLDELDVRGEYAEGRLVVEELRLRRGGGRASGSAVVDLSGERPAIQADLDFYGLDPAELAPLTLADLPGDFHGRLSVNSDGGPAAGIAAELELFPSRLRGVRIEQLRLKGHGTLDDFVVSEGFVRVGGARVNARGRITDAGVAFTVDGRDLSLDRLAGLVGEPSLAGRLDFRATLQGPPTDLRTRFDVLLTHFRYSGATAERGRLSGSLTLSSMESGVSLSSLLFELDARNAGYGENLVEQASVTGDLGLSEEPSFRGDLHLRGVTAAGRTFEEIDCRGGFAGGSGEIERLHLVVDPETSLEYQGRFSLTEPGFTLQTDLLHAVYRELDLLNTRPFTTELTGDDLRVEGLDLMTSAGPLFLEGTYGLGEEELNVRLSAPEVDLGALNAALRLTEEPVSGLVKLNLELGGRPLEPEVDLELSLTAVSYKRYHLRKLNLEFNLLPGVNAVRLTGALSGAQPLPAGEAPADLGSLSLTARGIGTGEFEVERLGLDARLTSSGVRLVGLDAYLIGGSMDAVGVLDLTDAGRPLELYFGLYNFPLDDLPFLPESVVFEDGNLTAQGHLSGPVGDLQADCMVRLDSRRLNLYDYNVALDDLAVQLAVTPDTVELVELDCLLGGGSLTGSGKAAYGAGLICGEAAFAGKGLQVKNLAECFSGTLDLEVAVSVGRTGTSVTGLVEVVDGNVDLPLGQQGAVKAGRPAAEGGESPLKLDLRIVAEKNLWVRSDLAELEVGADLHLTLLGGNLALGGDLETRRGSVYFLDKAFDLDSGTIRFNRTVPPDPSLSIKASSRMRRRTAGQTTENLTLVVNVGGKLSAPEISLSCAEHPEWPERDIIMLIALDMTWDDYQRMIAKQGAGGATRHATSQAAFFLASFIETKLQRLAREAVGLDTLKVEGIAESGEIDRLDITMGKYIFRDLYVCYSRDMLAEGNQSFSVEYFITDNLSLVGTTVEEEGELGYDLDLRWRFKY